MHHFTINDIEQLTGIKAHTLRVWEQRYDLTHCKRKDSGHRYYNDLDLKMMLRLAFLYKAGLKISEIAEMNQDQITETALTLGSHYNHEPFISQLLEASKQFNEPLFEKILHMSWVHLGAEKSVEDVIYPFLERLGLFWLTDNIFPSQEHFASNLIRKKIILSIDGLAVPDKKNKSCFLLFTPLGEAHELPLLYSNYLIRKMGTRTIYLGTQIQEENLDNLILATKPTHLYFHVITYLNNKSQNDYIKRIVSKFPEIILCFSGTGVDKYVCSSENEVFFPTLSDMKEYIKKAI